MGTIGAGEAIPEWELWACAHQLIKMHQEDAALVAAMRADELLALGDMDGVRTFTAIIRRIEKLLTPPDGPLN